MPESGISWEKGKGVIGLCWETKSSQNVNLDEPPFSELMQTTKQEWTAISSSVCFGLSYNDYQALKGKYGTVIAVPIVADGGGYKGCITLDMPPKFRLTNTQQAVESLATTADLVRRLLRG
jgi:hypothetical protein